MHKFDRDDEFLAEELLGYAMARMRRDPPPLDHSETLEVLNERAGISITPEGVGSNAAFFTFATVLAKACISVDHPRFFAFVPGAPSDASVLFDLVVSASNIYGGSWLEGSGVVYAENEALRWIADIAGFPAEAGGVFVSGGTAGNLSALIAARHRWRERANGKHDQTRGLMIAAYSAHSSVVQAARVMDCDVVRVPYEKYGILTADGLRETLSGLSEFDCDRVFAVVSSGGSTNAGLVDELGQIADVCTEHGVWHHVDGAYGCAALASHKKRSFFSGIERADSFIVDPHKWLFGPFDCCALIYRDPAVAKRAHTQHASYLDVLHDEGDAEWNPSDYAHHLSRRARGLPVWFSLATYGTNAYSDAVDVTLEVTLAGADRIRDAEHLELILEPELSILLFRRKGWDEKQYDAWCDQMLKRGKAFITPTKWEGDTVLRLCIVNPRTTIEDIEMIIQELA